MSWRIVTGEWDTLRDDAQRLRVEVFVIEQGVPIELEWDEGDTVSIHAVAYDDDNEPVATGRLLPDGHIGRMAVSKSLRSRLLRLRYRYVCIVWLSFAGFFWHAKSVMPEVAHQ